MLKFAIQNLECLCLRSIVITYFLQARSKPEDVTTFQQAKSYLIRSIWRCDQIISNFIFLKRIEAGLLVIDLGKAKALHALREKVKKLKIDTSIDLTWQRIENNEEKLRTGEIGEALELKSNSCVLFYTFDVEKVLHIWCGESSPYLGFK